MKPPWHFCCGWRSPWCALDTAAHVLHLPYWLIRPICDRHDRAITGECQ